MDGVAGCNVDKTAKIDASVGPMKMQTLDMCTDVMGVHLYTAYHLHQSAGFQTCYNHHNVTPQNSANVQVHCPHMT